MAYMNKRKEEELDIILKQIADRVKDEEQTVDYAEEFQKQTGKDLETGEYVTH